MAKTYTPILAPTQFDPTKLNIDYKRPDLTSQAGTTKPILKPTLKPKTNFGSVLDEYNTSLSGTGQAYAKILPDTKKKEIATGTQRFFEQAPSQAGFMQGVSLNNPKTTLEKKLGQTIDTSAAENQFAYKVGEGLGVASQFAIPYAGASGAIGKGVTKLLPNAGKFTPILKSVATDMAVGLPLNVNYALNKEGLRGNEALKSIAQNTAIDLVTGGILEAIGGIVLKSGKKVASKADLDNLPPAEKAEAMTELERLAYESNVRKGKITPQGNTLYGNAPQPIAGELPAPSAEIKPDLTKVYHGTKSDVNDIGDIRPGRQIVESGEPLPRADGTIGNKSTGTNKIYVTDNPQVAMSYGKVLEGYLPGKVLDVNSIANDYRETLPEFAKLFSDYETSPLLDARSRAVFRNTYMQGDVQNFIVDMDSKINEYLKSKGFSAVSIPYIDDVQGPSHEIILLGGNNLKSAQQLAYDAAKGQREAPFTVTPGEVQGDFPRTIPRQETPVRGADLPVQPVLPKKGTEIPPQPPIRPVEQELKPLGADTGRINETTQQNIDQFGAFKGGNIPKATAFGDTQKHANTLYNSSLADENLKERIAEAVNDGNFIKYTKHNATALKNADYEMKQGVESARTKFDSVSTSEKIPTSDDLALGYKLMKQYQEAGRYDDALAVAEDLSQMLSETGRTLQAARMANLLTPDGRLRMLGKAVNRMKKSSGQDIKLSNETLAAVKNAKSEKEIADANKRAFVEIWNQIPTRWTEKLNAWRYMSMLFNPKTHIRNIVGNMIFVPVRTLKNTIGAGLESKIIKNGGEKTKAILTSKDKDLLDFAKSDYPNVEGMLKNETKFADTLRDHDAKVFNTAILEKIRTLNGGALDKEDLFFLSKAYNSSMAQYMKANGLKAADMQGVKLDRARHYAMNEAAKATYRDTSEFAAKLNQTKRDLARSDNGFKKVMGIMLEGTVPFTKTPVNILKRGVEYSPVGLLNGAVKLRKALAKGENPVDAIDKLAAGLSGTGILAIGAWLNHMGVLQGSNDDPYGTKKNAFETMQGQQEYSLNFGDKSYTVDWAAPVSMPLFVGAELYKALSAGGVGFSEITDGILSIAEPMLNLSMLQGINEAVKTGFNDNAMFSVAETTLSGYASQFVPTVFGQVARSIDPVRRSTTSTAESTTQRQLERFKNKQIAKIPVLNKTLEPSIDLWGREQKNGNALEQFLSPGYFKKENVTPVDQEINRLSQNLSGEDVTKIIPRKTGQYDVVDKKVPYRMTEKELTQFQRTRGQESYNALTALFSSQQYVQMSDTDKVKAISKIYDQAFETAKSQMMSGRSVKY